MQLRGRRQREVRQGSGAGMVLAESAWVVSFRDLTPAVRHAAPGCSTSFAHAVVSRNSSSASLFFRMMTSAGVWSSTGRSHSAARLARGGSRLSNRACAPPAAEVPVGARGPFLATLAADIVLVGGAFGDGRQAAAGSIATYGRCQGCRRGRCRRWLSRALPAQSLAGGGASALASWSGTGQVLSEAQDAFLVFRIVAQIGASGSAAEVHRRRRIAGETQGPVHTVGSQRACWRGARQQASQASSA